MQKFTEYFSMKKFVIQCLKIVTPQKLRRKLIQKWEDRKFKIYRYNLKQKILEYYKGQKNISSQEQEVLSFLKRAGLEVFPYDYIYNYRKTNVKVFYDKEIDLNYVLHFNKQLYFKRKMSIEGIKSLYRGLLIDQAENSPHRYLNENFQVNFTDVVVDAGAAEGNFSLEIVDRVKKIILFENDPEWIEPLNATFLPWKEKVEIINKKIGVRNNDKEVKLDAFFEKENFTFIKADIEGDEYNLLMGLNNILERNIPLKLVLCTYHKENDYINFGKMLSKNGYTITTTRGYMIYFYDKLIRPPYLRKALIRAVKDD